MHFTSFTHTNLFKGCNKVEMLIVIPKTNKDASLGSRTFITVSTSFYDFIGDLD